MYPLGNISIVNKADTAEINIEGVIGVPENWQFDNPDERVSTYDKFKASISQIRDLKATAVTVNIRSLGGDVNDALLIYDTLLELGASITTKCYGYTASAATIIAQAAGRDKRFVSSNSLYLIHEPAMLAWGNKNVISEAVDMLSKTAERLVDIYAVRSGMDSDSFRALMSENNGNGKWLSPEEVIEAGLADGTFNASGPVNLPIDGIKVLNLPSIPQEKLLINDNKQMKINSKFKKVLDFFGFDTEKDHDMPEDGLDRLEQGLAAKDTRITDLESEKTNLTNSLSERDSQITAKDTEITNLTTKISNLEAELAKAKAEPTRTEAKEDPDPIEPSVHPRASAYEKDVECFKEQ